MASPEDGTSHNVAPAPAPTKSTAPSGDAPATSNPLPAVNLPKGGGAVRSIGEKFSVASITGTSSANVPILLSRNRNQFAPKLSLSYDSGSENGIFGFGWNLGLPEVSRKTDNGLPRYHDDEDSDIFTLSGAEDLVPLLEYANGKWVPVKATTRMKDGVEYQVQQYRPRIEGLFSRIEKWTDLSAGYSHWQTISNDNTTVVYGDSDNSRVRDPLSPTPRIFRWLRSKAWDDKSNAIAFVYKSEDSTGVDVTSTHEMYRSQEARSAQRHLKRIKYGNVRSYLLHSNFDTMDWLFEVVLDYGDHCTDVPLAAETTPWAVRHDPFSTYRAGFEVRTYRLCQRILMFHHFPDEPGIGRDCLVSAHEFNYRASESQDGLSLNCRIGSFVSSVVQRAFVRDSDGYRSQALPPLEFQYSTPRISNQIQQLDEDAVENVPAGVDDSKYRWMDLDGEGISGILTEQGGQYYYKFNLGHGRFSNLQALDAIPTSTSEKSQWMDLASEGRTSLVDLGGNTPGFYQRNPDIPGGWERYRAFESLPNTISGSKAVQYLDLTGNGRVDILLANDEIWTWYPSLGERGYGPAELSRTPDDDDRGPRVLVSDVMEAIYVADMSGDGLLDLLRIRNGCVEYWPNLGYGRFGAKVAMGNSPWFDSSEIFQQNRVRLFDIDGSGTTDLIYLAAGEVRYYQNEAGNSWSSSQVITNFQHTDNLSQVQVVDLLGRGVGCLVWSSKLPGNIGSGIKFIDLMGEKPHLLTSIVNNMGSETRIHYRSSTEFFLDDKAAGRPWKTRLPFPVHVVERVESFDYIGRNRFVTRYAYHHGFYDGFEREFRGFGYVEQWDTEEFAALEESNSFPDAVNLDAASNMPPMYTRSWYHTGAYAEDSGISNHYEQEYYREPGLNDAEYQGMLLDDTILPNSARISGSRFVPFNLSHAEAREAARALKGQPLRVEVYGLDGTSSAKHPYTVTESNYSVEVYQPMGENQNAVFFSEPRETLSFQYERNLYSVNGRRLADPRVTHSFTLDTDEWGHTKLSAAVTYGRRHADSSGLLKAEDIKTQQKMRITFSQHSYTNPVLEKDDYRTPIPAENFVYELMNVDPPRASGYGTSVFDRNHLHQLIRSTENGDHDLLFDDYLGSGITGHRPFRRLLGQDRHIYRRNDLSGPLPVGKLESLAVPHLSLDKVMTSSFAKKTYVQTGKIRADDLERTLRHDCGYVHGEDDLDWWAPSGQVFYSPTDCSPQGELAYAREHFFSPLRFWDPFFTAEHRSEWVTHNDRYDLLVCESVDPLGNRITVGNRGVEGPNSGFDYRLLAPTLVTDVNGNRSFVAYDTMGYVVATAIKGKIVENLGDSLDGVKVNLTEKEVRAHFETPFETAHALLGNATGRFVYDPYAFFREKKPPAMTTITRETSANDLKPGEKSKFLLNVSYFDGSSRTAQQKFYAGAGALGRGPTPEAIVPQRWICSGWSIYNNKGKAIQKYEPFFTEALGFEFAVKIGVTSTLFFDTSERLVASLFADGSWSKAVYDAWGEERWDANDTVLLDPRKDPDVGDYFRRLGPDTTNTEHQTWYQKRINGGTGEQEHKAALKAAAHEGTPTKTFMDSLGRVFLKVEHNRYKDHVRGRIVNEFPRQISIIDIEGLLRKSIDQKDRVVAAYEYDLSGSQVHGATMEAGESWRLSDVLRGSAYLWDNRRKCFRTVYDILRRTVEIYISEPDYWEVVTEKVALRPDEILLERTVYGETLPDAERRNCRLKPVKVLDQAGIVCSDDYDYKGNILSTRRQMAKEYKVDIDWAMDIELEEEVFKHSSVYDALNRKIQVTTADGSVTRSFFNENGLLTHIDVKLFDGEETSAYVEHIEYNARGQRKWILAGNGIRTDSTYDDFTFHLKSIVSKRTSQPGTSSPRSSSPSLQGDVQSLHYTYDPIGNIAHILDRSQSRIFFRGKVVDPSNDYTYDALYRLMESSGREHLSQAAGAKDVHDNDGTAMAKYVERYQYDLAGNMLSMTHVSMDESQPAWTRCYEYNEPSQLEPEKLNNRLSCTKKGRETEFFRYGGEDGVAGVMSFMSTLQHMQWDYRDNLRATARQAVRDGTVPEMTFYRYDSRGARVRKVTERQRAENETPTISKERLYIGPHEIFRRFAGHGNPTSFEQKALRVVDDEQLLALVETRTIGDRPAPRQIIRYQLPNHQGSVSVELTSDGELLSCEEYSAYGDTTYRFSSNQLDVPNRYRFNGKEKDTESGLYYFGARYYLPHIRRWISPDPSGFTDGLNRYQFTKCNPVSKKDPNGMESSWFNRAVGALQVVGGAMGMAVGAAGIAAPTGVTQVLGAVAFVHGADTTWAGLKAVWTGEAQKTYTEQAATGIAKAAGASESTAETIGMITDLAVGIIPQAAIGLSKAGAIGAAKVAQATKTARAAVGSGLRKAGSVVAREAQAFASDNIAIAKGIGNEIKAMANAMDTMGTGGMRLASATASAGGEGGGLLAKAAGVAADVQKDFIMMKSGKDAAAGVINRVGQGAEKLTGPAARARLEEAAEKLVQLRKGAGKSVDTMEKVVQHHLAPKWQEIRPFFDKSSVNVHETILGLKTKYHQVIHGNHPDVTGFSDMRLVIKDWIEKEGNKMVDEMLERGESPTEAVMSKLKEIADEFGIANELPGMTKYKGPRS